MTTTTTNYGWVKPDVGASDDVWGGYINTDLDGVDSVVKGVSVVANAAYPASNPSGYQTAAQVASVVIGDNRIINGDMRIDQRNNGASGTAGGVYTADRWFINQLVGKFSWQRISSNVSAPYAGSFAYALLVTSLSAYVPAAGDSQTITQSLEFDTISDFSWGFATAQSVTLSFYAYCSLAGTFGGSIRNGAATRSYPFSYSIPTANAWTKVIIPIPGDTGGTWGLVAGNAKGLDVNFDLGTGSTYRAAANAWISGNYTGANGAVNICATNGATFYVTGVKLEIGSVATPFNRQSLAKSMADCQRYYQTSGMQLMGYAVSGTTVGYTISFPVVMRGTPTMVVTNNASNGVNAPTFPFPAANTAYISATTSTTGGFGIIVAYTASAEL